MADIDLTRLDAGTKVNIWLAVEALGRLGNFVGAALDLVDDIPLGGTPEQRRTVAALTESARAEMKALRANLDDLVKTEKLDALDGPAGAAPRVAPAFRMEVTADDEVPRLGEVKSMDLWAQASPASNAASDARDLSMVLVRALGTHDLGFGPDELVALYTVAGMLTEQATEAADRADAVCRLIDRPEEGETGSITA